MFQKQTKIPTLTITLTVTPFSDEWGTYQYDFHGTSAPNEYLGLMLQDGNMWQLVTTTYADNDGNYIFRVAFPYDAAGLTQVYRVHNYGVTDVSNEVTLVIGSGFEPNGNGNGEIPPPVSSILWLAIPAAVIVIGIGIYYITKKKR